MGWRPLLLIRLEAIAIRFLVLIGSIAIRVGKVQTPAKIQCERRVIWPGQVSAAMELKTHGSTQNPL